MAINSVANRVSDHLWIHEGELPPLTVAVLESAEKELRRLQFELEVARSVIAISTGNIR